MSIDEKVLLVDDDVNLLSGLRRQLHGKYGIITAAGGEKALDVLAKETAIAVVVCDMRMPGMSGVETLEVFSKKAPTTTRIMLTGNADQDCAVEAVNKGHIFRFLNKPCSTEDLCSAIDAGLRQYHLINAEKKLLETTLAGSVKLLSDVVSLMDPAAAGNTRKIAAWAAKLAPISRGSVHGN
jgi:DNA-binding NtrC family response regulator